MVEIENKNEDNDWVLMINRDNPDLEYVMQRYIGHWFLIKHDCIIDHNQYRNDLIEKYNLVEKEEG
jgi:hypothetical protein